MIFTFTEEDLEIAGMIGWRRNYRNYLKGRRLEPGRTDDGTERHIRGAMTEYAVAKLLGVEYNPIDDLDTNLGDVAGLQIKSIDQRNLRLIIRTRDPSRFKYVLCLSTFLTVEILGWIEGREGKVSKFWKTIGHAPAFYVPQLRLNKPETLCTAYL